MDLIEINLCHLKFSYMDPSVRIYCVPEDFNEIHSILSKHGFMLSTITITFKNPVVIACLKILTAKELTEKLADMVEDQKRVEDAIFSNKDKVWGRSI